MIVKFLIKIGQTVLQLIYQVLKVFPVQNKITMISRQSNDPSIDFLLLRDEIRREAPSVKVVFLCKKMCIRDR